MKRLPHETVARHRLYRVGLIVALVQPGILVLFLLASLALTGGQVARAKGAIYGQVVPFPVFPVPGWLMLALAVLTLVLMTAYTIGAQLLDSRLIAGLYGPVLGSVVAAVFFRFAGTTDETVMHSAAVWLDVAAVVPLVIATLRFGREYDRRMRAGTLPDGYL